MHLALRSHLAPSRFPATDGWQFQSCQAGAGHIPLIDTSAWEQDRDLGIDGMTSIQLDRRASICMKTSP